MNLLNRGLAESLDIGANIAEPIINAIPGLEFTDAMRPDPEPRKIDFSIILKTALAGVMPLVLLLGMCVVLSYLVGLFPSENWSCWFRNSFHRRLWWGFCRCR